MNRIQPTQRVSRMKKGLFVLTCLVLLLGALFTILMNLLERVQLGFAEQRIGFVKILESAEIKHPDVLKAMYTGLFADYCYFTADKESLLFKYTLKTKMEEVLVKITTLNNTVLKEQATSLALNCPEAVTK
ncbi:hypothetical protein NI389_12215 [Pseudoalteromonas xiamenensis]|uniref:hypothetical protein n=1 Tax=Pseudoalteromonas xiamenensis TaxID=882626 RepID=UPI0027E4C641|nr:hypothetical protein [Pseudoalteromonas xiamenensis]WMN58979.1 hypothetical protein NI389_12215 [Pseudoalteromonas xiamenensis]